MNEGSIRVFSIFKQPGLYLKERTAVGWERTPTEAWDLPESRFQLERCLGNSGPQICPAASQMKFLLEHLFVEAMNCNAPISDWMLHWSLTSAIQLLERNSYLENAAEWSEQTRQPKQLGELNQP